MSDKTKKLRDEALFARRAEAERQARLANPIAHPRCWCGVTYGPDTKLWAVQEKGVGKFYCDDHLPEHVRAAAGLE